MIIGSEHYLQVLVELRRRTRRRIKNYFLIKWDPFLDYHVGVDEREGAID